MNIPRDLKPVPVQQLSEVKAAIELLYEAAIKDQHIIGRVRLTADLMCFPNGAVDIRSFSVDEY